MITLEVSKNNYEQEKEPQVFLVGTLPVDLAP